MLGSFGWLSFKIKSARCAIIIRLALQGDMTETARWPLQNAGKRTQRHAICMARSPGDKRSPPLMFDEV